MFLFSKEHNTPLWDYQTNGDLKDGKMTPNGSYIAAGGGHKMVYLLSQKGEAVAQYITQYPVWCLAVTPDGKYVSAMDGWLVEEEENSNPYERCYFLSEKVKWQFSLNNTGNAKGKVAISDSGKYEIFSMEDKIYLFITTGLNNTEGGREHSSGGGILEGRQNLLLSVGALIVIAAVLVAYWKRKGGQNL